MHINHSYRVVHHVSYPNLWRFITMVTINCTPKKMKYGIYPVKYGIIATLELALNIHTSQLFSCDRTRDWDQTPVSEFRSRPPKFRAGFRVFTPEWRCVSGPYGKHLAVRQVIRLVFFLCYVRLQGFKEHPSFQASWCEKTAFSWFFMAFLLKSFLLMSLWIMNFASSSYMWLILLDHLVLKTTAVSVTIPGTRKNHELQSETLANSVLFSNKITMCLFN